MEESQQSQKQSQRNRKLDFSVVLSFAVAIFAVFSIGTFAVVSNQGSSVSYAAPTNDSFTLKMPDRSTAGGIDAGVSGTQTDGNGGGTVAGSFYVPYYYAGEATEANRLFCVEKGIETQDGNQYTKGSAVEDAGLIYILSHSYANGINFMGASGSGAKYIEIWGTQAAIWLYMDEKYDDAKYKLPTSGTSDTLALMQAAKYFAPMPPRTGVNDVDTYQFDNAYAKVRKLVDDAKAASKVVPKVNVNKASDSMVKTSDGKYYQTSIITVAGSPSGNFKSYDIRVSGIDGAKVVDENGKDLALTNVAVGKKFYVRIPANKVTEKVQTLKVEVTGHFDLPGATYYVSAGHQTLTTVSVNPTDGHGEVEFEVVGVPDTGMNAAQTIYFIGLIVLLCGVGIVYANAKPVQNKQ